MKNVKQANINITLKNLFFKWIEVTKMFHKLAPQEERVLAMLLYYHYQLKKDITNESILWKIVFDYDTKKKIKDNLNIKDQSLQNSLTLLRKKNVIKNNKISNAFIPELDQDSNNFKIIFNFNIIKDE